MRTRKRGRFVSDRSAIERFAEKCEHDPRTGCVLWTGGTSSGRGNSARYGVFWDEGRRHFAHRWAAVHLHGLDPGTSPVGHICPAGPNTLCVQHVEVTTPAENNAEQHARLGNPAKRLTKAEQTLAERQYWLLVGIGVEPEPEKPDPPNPGDIPFHTPPEWLRPFLAKQEEPDECPF